MNHKDSERLSQSIEQYLLHRMEQGYPDEDINSQHKILLDFQVFAEKQIEEWNAIFTLGALRKFMYEGSNSSRRQGAVRGVANFLYQEKLIPQPIPRKARPTLPKIFEDYLHYCTTTRYDTQKMVEHMRRILEAFNHYLKHNNIQQCPVRDLHVVFSFFCEVFSFVDAISQNC